MSLRRGIRGAVALLALAAGCGEPVPAGPRLVLDPPRHDFGVLFLGESREFTCTLRNAGSADLTIQDTRTSCGCLLLELSASRVPPGSSAQLAVEYHADRLRSAADKVVTVLSNDGEAVLLLAAEVVSAYDLEPPVVDLGDVVHGTSGTARVTVAAPGDLQVLDLPPVPRLLPLACRELEAGRFEVTVATSPEVRPGAFVQEAVVHTDHPRQPELKIPVRFSVVPALTLSDERVDLGRVLSGEGGAGSVEVRRRPGAPPVEGESVAVVMGGPQGNSGRVRAELREQEPGVWSLRIEVPTGAAPGPLVGRVDLRTRGVAPYVYTIVLSGEVVAE